MLRECVNGGTRRRAHSATFSQHGWMKSSPRTCLDRSMLGLVSEFQRMRWRMGPPNQPLHPDALPFGRLVHRVGSRCRSFTADDIPSVLYGQLSQLIANLCIILVRPYS